MGDDAESSQDWSPSPPTPLPQAGEGSSDTASPQAGEGTGEPTWSPAEAQVKPSADVPLPWFTGFLLLFPPALIAYLLWRLISQAGALPEDEECGGDGGASPPRET